nr:MAG TPA: hypothetical protein [Caudoviricetes sp.]
MDRLYLHLELIIKLLVLLRGGGRNPLTCPPFQTSRDALRATALVCEHISLL